MITVNGLIHRMSPETMVDLLGDLVEMGVNDSDDSERQLIVMVTRELIANVGGEEAAYMLDEADVSHWVIDAELEKEEEE